MVGSPQSVCFVLPALVLFVGLLVGGCIATVPAGVVVPDWDDVEVFATNSSACVQPSANISTHRWTHFAIPTGKKPGKGWPVFIKFPPWTVPSQNTSETCGPQRRSKLPASCLDLVNKSCPFPLHPNATSTCEKCVVSIEHTNVTRWNDAGCGAYSKYVPSVWCNGHGNFSPKRDIKVFASPTSILSKCFTSTGIYVEANCTFMGLAGQMWEMRMRQFLLANGVAVLQPNPATMDYWEWYGQDTWDTGLDKDYFSALFTSIRGGTFGGLGPNALDLDRVAVSGYSVGAQMVSWFFQLQATQQLPLITVKAGVFLGGGTYGCYQYPPLAMAQCSDCDPSNECLDLGCSNELVALGRKPCCQYCCPQHFTEQHFRDHPEDYHLHPPTFLMQPTTVDENADTCAAKNYHAEMLKHNADSTLLLIPVEEERCFCVGSPNFTSDVLSPFTPRCKDFLPGLGPTNCTLPPNTTTMMLSPLGSPIHSHPNSNSQTNTNTNTNMNTNTNTNTHTHTNTNTNTNSHTNTHTHTHSHTNTNTNTNTHTHTHSHTNMLGECQTPSYAGQRCMMHTMGYGGMIDPFISFIQRTL